MNRRALDALLDGLAPSHDEGWTWLRKMHELGMDLRMESQNVFPGFIGHDSVGFSVLVNIRAGAAVWVPMFDGEYMDDSGVLHAGEQRVSGRAVFHDPVTAAVWAVTEVANLPPKTRKQDVSGQPKVAPVMPGPAMPMPAPAMPMPAPAWLNAPPPHPWEPGSQ